MFLFKRRASVPVIASPKAALFNLAGLAGNQLAELDAAFLREFFGDVRASDTLFPQCDVLFLYASFLSDGCIIGSTQSLREIIRDSGAKIVDCASENQGEGYRNAASRKAFGRANLVMTLERRGDAFLRFFTQLFSKMMQRISMPVAWVEISPQIPGQARDHAPALIFACEIGQVTFMPPLSPPAS